MEVETVSTVNGGQGQDHWQCIASQALPMMTQIYRQMSSGAQPASSDWKVLIFKYSCQLRQILGNFLDSGSVDCLDHQLSTYRCVCGILEVLGVRVEVQRGHPINQDLAAVLRQYVYDTSDLLQQYISVCERLRESDDVEWSHVWDVIYNLMSVGDIGRTVHVIESWRERWQEEDGASKVLELLELLTCYMDLYPRYPNPTYIHKSASKVAAMYPPLDAQGAAQSTGGSGVPTMRATTATLSATWRKLMTRIGDEVLGVLPGVMHRAVENGRDVAQQAKQATSRGCQQLSLLLSNDAPHLKALPWMQRLISQLMYSTQQPVMSAPDLIPLIPSTGTEPHSLSSEAAWQQSNAKSATFVLQALQVIAPQKYRAIFVLLWQQQNINAFLLAALLPLLSVTPFGFQIITQPLTKAPGELPNTAQNTILGLATVTKAPPHEQIACCAADFLVRADERFMEAAAQLCGACRYCGRDVLSHIMHSTVEHAEGEALHVKHGIVDQCVQVARQYQLVDDVEELLAGKTKEQLKVQTTPTNAQVVRDAIESARGDLIDTCMKQINSQICAGLSTDGDSSRDDTSARPIDIEALRSSVQTCLTLLSGITAQFVTTQGVLGYVYRGAQENSVPLDTLVGDSVLVPVPTIDAYVSVALLLRALLDLLAGKEQVVGVYGAVGNSVGRQEYGERLGTSVAGDSSRSFECVGFGDNEVGVQGDNVRAKTIASNLRFSIKRLFTVGSDVAHGATPAWSFVPDKLVMCTLLSVVLQVVCHCAGAEGGGSCVSRAQLVINGVHDNVAGVRGTLCVLGEQHSALLAHCATWLAGCGGMGQQLAAGWNLIQVAAAMQAAAA